MSRGILYHQENPKAANIFPGFPSDSVEHRPERTTDDTTGSYAKHRPSFNVWFQKISIPPPRRELEIPKGRGGGGSKTQEIPEGRGVV